MLQRKRLPRKGVAQAKPVLPVASTETVTPTEEAKNG